MYWPSFSCNFKRAQQVNYQLMSSNNDYLRTLVMDNFIGSSEVRLANKRFKFLENPEERLSDTSDNTAPFDLQSRFGDKIIEMCFYPGIDDEFNLHCEGIEPSYFKIHCSLET